MACSQNCDKQLLASSRLSVHVSAWNNLVPIWHIFMKLDIYIFFYYLLRKYTFHSNLTRKIGTLHKDLCTFMIIFHSILPWMRNSSDKSCTENQNTHFWSTIFFSKNCAVYVIIWKNMVEPDRPQMTIQHTHIARWLRECTSMLLLYLHCLLVCGCIKCSLRAHENTYLKNDLVSTVWHIPSMG